MDIAQRFARVLASAIWGFLATMLLRYLGVSFDPDHAAAIEGAMIVFLSAMINALIGVLSKQFPQLEWLLFVPTKPTYLTQEERKSAARGSPPDVKKKLQQK